VQLSPVKKYAPGGPTLGLKEQFVFENILFIILVGAAKLR
jgi:hypothetical protein